MALPIRTLVFSTTGFTEVEAVDFITAKLLSVHIKMIGAPAPVSKGVYAVKIECPANIDVFLKSKTKPVSVKGTTKTYCCHLADTSKVTCASHRASFDSDQGTADDDCTTMPGLHIHITGIKPVVDGVIADAMRSVVDRPLRAVRGISQKGAAYANITFDEEVTYEEVANIAQQLRRADAAVYANIVEKGNVRPSFTLYERKRVPKCNLYVTKISAEKPTEAELYEAFGKYGVVASVYVPKINHTAYVQFKDEPTLNIEELRETLASPELHVAQYATAKDRASRTLFVTFPIETTEDVIREIFAKHTTAVPKIMPKSEGFKVRAATITLATAEAMTTLLDQIKSDSLVVDAVPYYPRSQRQAEIAKKYEDHRTSIKVNYRDCNVYVSSISTAGVDMAALREKFAQFIGDRKFIRQGIFDPKEGAETTFGFVQFATPAAATDFVANINGKTNAEVFGNIFTPGAGERVIKAAVVRPKEEHVSAKQAAARDQRLS